MIGDAMADDEYKLKPVELPDDDEEFYARDFFAYGIFKRGQLAYSKISDCVESVAPDEIHRKMHIRDGMPLVLGEDDDFTTKGDKIHFGENAKCAYKRISDTQPANIYKWDTVEIDEETFNILITDNINGTFEHVDNEGDYLNDFDGHEDPFFSQVPVFIEEELEKIVEDENFIFKIQMYYMLLWSAIERYCKLKYDVSNVEGDYLKELSNDEVFINAFESVNPNGRGPIYAAKNASPFYYNKSRPNYIINYYYTIRCNVAHRGKEPENSTDKLISSLKDLLKIFKKMIDDTFI